MLPRLPALVLPVLSAGCELPYLSGPTDECVVLVAPPGQRPESFASLSRALDAVEAGAVLSVCASPPVEAVTVRRAVTLLGAPGARIQGAPGSPALRIEAGADSLVQIRGIEIAGGIHAEGSVLVASDLSVSAAGGDCIEVVGGSLSIDHVTLSSCAGNGLVVTGSEGSASSMTIDGVAESGVVAAAASLDLDSVIVRNAGRNGLEVAGGSVKASMLTSESHVRSGLLLGAGATLICSTCTLVSGIDGVRVSGGSLLSLTGSAIEAPKNIGIAVGDDSLAWVKDTQIERAFTGLVVDGELTQLTATGVMISGSGDSGVVVNAGSLIFSLGGASGSGSDGLHVMGGSVVVSAAAFDNNGLNGISLGGVTTAAVRARVEGNAQWGLACDGGPGNVVTSDVTLQICDLDAAGNAEGPVSLINGCQQDQFCTVQTP